MFCRFGDIFDRMLERITNVTGLHNVKYDGSVLNSFSLIECHAV